jgi:hypothetical protein
MAGKAIDLAIEISPKSPAGKTFLWHTKSGMKCLLLVRHVPAEEEIDSVRNRLYAFSGSGQWHPMWGSQMAGNHKWRET